MVTWIPAEMAHRTASAAAGSTLRHRTQSARSASNLLDALLYRSDQVEYVQTHNLVGTAPQILLGCTHPPETHSMQRRKPQDKATAESTSLLARG